MLWLYGFVVVCVGCVSWLCELVVCVLSVHVRVDGVRVCVLVVLVFMGLCVCVYSCVDVFMYVHVDVCVSLYLYRCAYVSIRIDRFVALTSFSAWGCMAVLRLWSDASG